MLAFAPPTPDATPIWLVSAENWPAVKSTIGAPAATFAGTLRLPAKGRAPQLLPGKRGELAGVLFGVDEADAPTRDPFGPGKPATTLPEGVYRLANPPRDADLAALGFLLALYRYDRFKADKSPRPRLVAPDEIDAIRIQRIAQAITFGRNLVNTPANALGPDALEQEAVKLAEHFDASVSMVRGEELSPRTFPSSTRSVARGPKSRASSTFPGDARTRRRWRLSARASLSTPAASTSSRPRAWS